MKRKILATFGHGGENPSSYSKFPIHECLVAKTLFEIGIGYVIFTRKSSDGCIALSAFIVDVYCLGVKNALFKVSTESEYENSIKPQLMRSSEEMQFENVHPTYARKLIEGSVSYAKDLGFSPHRDYNYAKGIFGKIDSCMCPEKIVYGKDDKPFYIRGPNESVDQAKQIVGKLSRKLGEENFDYTIMLDEGLAE
ncbi:hypothetical protein MNBD_GAMMA04-480 [hydrothermal vent metagenome]|uniref:Uncharacterized protein n=1 Tax=hydrothermal vent metagenome TaxID=652676 RepID=A0A3B0VR29_9ZZZZ